MTLLLLSVQRGLKCRTLFCNRAVQRSLCLSSVRSAPPWVNDATSWLSECWTTKLLQEGFVALHETVHLPWWATIVVMTASLRLVAVPLAVWAERLSGQRALMEQAVYTNVLRDLPPRARALRMSDEQIKIQVQSMYQSTSNKIARLKGLQNGRIIVLKMAPTFLWVSSSFALRNLVQSGAMAGGGCLWFPDLLASDPLLLLPVINFVAFYLNSRLSRVKFPSELEYSRTAILFKTRQYLWIGVGLAIIPIASVLPSCFPFFWCLLSSTSLLQGLLLQHPRIKKILGIHRLPTDTSTPFRQLFRSPIDPFAKVPQKSSK